MKRDEAISRLQQHEADLKRLGVGHLYLFGSTARGEARDDSDVDLFFDYEKGKLGLFELMDVKEYAAGILGRKTDIMTRDSLHKMLREKIRINGGPRVLMVPRSLVSRLTDIVEAIERIHGVLDNISLQEFETDWQRQWLVERGIEIISEASRHLTDEMKARHPEIPWQTSMTAANDLAVRRALESAGVEFIDENGGGPGVRLQKATKEKPGK